MEKIASTKAPAAAGPYSQAIIANKFMFLSGQIYLKPEGGLLEGTEEEQIKQIMNNLSEVLVEVGLNFSNVVKTTIYLTDMSKYQLVNQVYGSYLTDPFPARETVCVKELPLGAWAEISMIAAIE